MSELKIISRSEAETVEIGGEIAPLFDKGTVIILLGDLASGKTHFVKGFAKQFNYKESVTSPTFSLANFYKCEEITLLHMDLYRLKSIEEFDDLGIEEYFDESIVLVEWGEELLDHIDDYVLVQFAHNKADKDFRELSISYKGDKLEKSISRLSEVISRRKLC